MYGNYVVYSNMQEHIIEQVEINILCCYSAVYLKLKCLLTLIIMEDLEKSEDGPAITSNHLQQRIKVSAVSCLTVRSTESECEKVQHCSNDQGTSTSNLTHSNTSLAC